MKFFVNFFMLLFFVNCGGNISYENEKTNYVESPIYNGKKDNSEIVNSTVQLFINRNKLCSGTLITNNLIATAYHCIADLSEDKASCGSSEKEIVTSINDPKNVQIYTGEISQLDKNPVAIGKKIFHPSSKKLCGNDIAFLLINKSIGIKPIMIRIDQKIYDGETFKIVGYGLNNINELGVANQPFGVRLSMNKSPVKFVYTNEFSLVGGSLEQETPHGGACSGDSGGPAISETTNNLVGVLSRGGNCETSDQKIYTFIGSHLDILNDALAESNAILSVENNSNTNIPNLQTEQNLSHSKCSFSYNEKLSSMNYFFMIGIFFLKIFRKSVKKHHP